MQKKLFLIISSIGLLVCGQENRLASSNQDQVPTKNTKEKVRRFVYLDSLSLELEAQNYIPPYEETQLELIEIGIKIDSLDRVAYQAIGLSWYYNNISNQPRKSLALNTKILALDSTAIRDFYTGLLYREKGDAHFFLKDNQAAIESYNKAISIFERLENIQILAETLMYLSAPQSNVGDFVEAINTMRKSLALFEETGDVYNVNGMRIELGLLYSKYGFKEEALIQYNSLLETESVNPPQKAVTLLNKANLLKAEKKFEVYFELINEAITVAENSNRKDFILPNLLLGLAETSYQLGNSDEAESYLTNFESAYGLNNKSLELQYKSVQVEKLLKEENYQQALEELNFLLENHLLSKNWSDVVKTRKRMVKPYQELGNTKKALEHQIEFTKLKDSIEEDKKLKALSYYKTQFETEQKDRKIAEQYSDITVLQLENESKQKTIVLIAAIGFFLVISTRFFYLKKQHKKESELQSNFSQQLMQTQEDERLRISRDLHDSVGQSLSIAKRELGANNTKLDGILNHTIDEVRQISQSIYPYTLEKFGLSYAVEKQIEQIKNSSEINIQLKLQDLDKELNKNEKLNIFRLIQEALNNTLKHAEATKVSVSLMKLPSFIQLQIEDNGKGFNYKHQVKNSKSFGLQSMQQRADLLNADLNIKSDANGTCIVIKMNYA